MLEPIVLKLGGAIFENETALANLCQALASVQERPLVLVHGGGVIVESLLAHLGLVSEKIEGLRVTPHTQIDYVTGALAGTANKKLTAAILRQGRAAVGLCLGDGGLCRVTQLDAKFGAVGQCHSGDPELLTTLLEQHYLPVISSIGIGDDGQLYNVNADQAAVAIGKMLQGPLVLLSDVPGVLDEDGQLIESLDKPLAEQLIASGTINGGMAVKVKAALDASEAMQQVVILAGWKDADALSKLLMGESVGTTVSATNTTDKH
ncbi:acetylglutamate kinase [Celerinatantimonas sp. MCCC 1A17872]|uniref:acetylglutamate kinase n=1 Tax=Celerinatantimonas sp. MCCC 1A17872 TaxID=3177514 RepID=UPI0038BE3EED